MNQLFTAVFVFVITCKIARGNPLFCPSNYDVLEEPPSGFHYESLITLPYSRNTYTIMPMRDAVSVMARRSGMTAGTTRSKRGFLSLWSDDGGQQTAADKTAGGDKTSVELQADDDEGYLHQIGSAIVDIGEDVESSLVTAAPYLPLVTKVALFLVPGLREYQMLVMALNVASITSEAYKRYDDGEGLTTVAASAAWQMFTLKKRSDTDTTFKEYAQDMYNLVKESLASHFSPRLIHSESTDDEMTTTTNQLSGKTDAVVGQIDETVGLLGTGSGVKTIKTTVTKSYNINGVEMPEVETTETKNSENGIEMVNDEIFAGGEMVQSADSQSPGTSEASDESEEEGINENELDVEEEIEIDKSLFYKYLNESMSLQPEFIQHKSGEELVQFLDSVDIKLPDSVVIDSRNIFYVLTSIMDFEDDVTDEQIDRLVDVLTKATNYFIDTAIRTKKCSTKQDTS